MNRLLGRRERASAAAAEEMEAQNDYVDPQVSREGHWSSVIEDDDDDDDDDDIVDVDADDVLGDDDDIDEDDDDILGESLEDNESEAHGMPLSAADSAGYWHEKRDEFGMAYFVNELTGESRWERPEWVEQYDPNTGCAYYVKEDPSSGVPLHSTWRLPPEGALRMDLRDLPLDADSDAFADVRALSKKIGSLVFFVYFSTLWT